MVEDIRVGVSIPKRMLGFFTLSPYCLKKYLAILVFINFPFKSTLYLSFKTNYLLILINLYNLQQFLDNRNTFQFLFSFGTRGAKTKNGGCQYQTVTKTYFALTECTEILK